MGRRIPQEQVWLWGYVQGVGGVPIRQLETWVGTQVEIKTMSYLHGGEDGNHEHQ